MTSLTPSVGGSAWLACVAVASVLALPVARAGAVDDGGPSATRPALLSSTSLYGVTLTNLHDLDAIVASLQALPVRMIVRVVLDPQTPVESYVRPLRRLHQVSWVMAQLLDSSDYRRYEAGQMQRLNKFLDAAGDLVDLWEIGNEINGRWVNPHPGAAAHRGREESAQVGRQVSLLFDRIKQAGGQAAVTLFYNDDGLGHHCWEHADESWRSWAVDFLPLRVRQRMDYVFLSYYPWKDCPGMTPDWDVDFGKLGDMFATAKLGFGEIGTSSTSAPRSVQTNLIKTFYGETVRPGSPRFVGGYFWWHYVEQMVPHGRRAYWETLRQALQSDHLRRSK